MKLILSNLPRYTADFHKLFKILYFAERMHLARYGRSITEDSFVAMKDGPVPSTIYDILKVIRGDSIFHTEWDYSKDFSIENRYFVTMKDGNFDIDIFSESELECITESIGENKQLSFPILRDKSHDTAWHSANRDEEMSIFDIAKAGGADEQLLSYMSIIEENKNWY